MFLGFLERYLKSKKKELNLIKRDLRFIIILKKKCIKFTDEGMDSKFMMTATYTNAKKYLVRKGYEDVEEMKLREIRNILMSLTPSIDQKTYTFRECNLNSV